jgi:nucleoside-diphosphate-sugar epimerase
MKLLLVGGTGVLSTAITQEALNNNIEVYMVNRGHRQELIPKDVHLLKSDIHDEKRVISLIGDLFFDAVIDCICYTEKDLKYSFNLFKDKTNQYIFISSCAVYNTAIDNVCDENAPKVTPSWKYSVDKNKCEELLIRLAHENHVNYTIIRPAVTYGNMRIPYGITPPYGYHWTIAERILHGKPIITWNKGENRSNKTHVNDFAIGVAGLLGNKQAYNEAFNIVGDETPSWKDVLDTLADLLGTEVKIFDLPSEYYANEVPARRGEILGGRATTRICSNRKIKSAVKGFKQYISLREGLQRTIAYYKAHHYIHGIDYTFDADTDRIIAKYAKQHKLPMKGVNLQYIDYLNERNIKNKLTYIMTRHKDNFVIRHILYIIKIVKYIVEKVKK